MERTTGLVTPQQFLPELFQVTRVNHLQNKSEEFNLITEPQWRKVAQELALSPQELRVCQFVFKCKTRQEMAEAMGIKDRTVRTYLEQIHIKLSVTTRVGIALRIVETRDAIAK